MRGTVVIITVGILSKLVSFLSEAILASCLGTTYQSDAYYMVSSVHQVIYPMLSIGIWKVFLPLYKEKITNNQIDLANSLSNKALTFFAMASLAAVGLLVLAPQIVVAVVAPGFKGETKALCAKLIRLSAPMYVFITASAVYAAALQCHDRFFGSQIREVVTHIPTIITAWAFYRYFGVEAFAVALAVGGVVRLAVELPFVNWGYRFTPDFQFRGKEFSLVLRRLPSAMISEGVTLLNTLVDKAMASTLSEGTVSSLNYGHKLMNVFSGLLSTSIATAVYPQMIELITMKEKDNLNKMVVKIINIYCVIMIPVTVACVLFRTELVSVTFERGSFTSESTRVTSAVFALYALGILFVACNTVITNLFYGYGNTKTPMHISISNLLINVVLNLLLIKVWGINGLALATSVSAFITFFVRIIALKKYIVLDYKDMISTTGKVLIASVVTCAMPRIVFSLHPVGKFLVLALSALFAVPFYFLELKLLGITELQEVISMLKKTKP